MAYCLAQASDCHRSRTSVQAQAEPNCLWHELGGSGEAVVGSWVGQMVVEVLEWALASDNGLRPMLILFSIQRTL